MLQSGAPNALAPLLPLLIEKLSSTNSSSQRKSAELLLAHFANQIKEGELIGKIVDIFAFPYINPREIDGFANLIKNNGTLAALAPVIHNLYSSDWSKRHGSARILIELFGSEIQDKALIEQIVDAIRNMPMHSTYLTKYASFIKEISPLIQNSPTLAKKIAGTNLSNDPANPNVKRQLIANGGDHLLDDLFKGLTLMAYLPDIKESRAKVNSFLDVLSQRVLTHGVPMYSNLRDPDVPKEIKQTLERLKQLGGYDLAKIAKIEAFIAPLMPQARI